MFNFGEGTSVCNYADDNTSYACDKSLEKLLGTLERETSVLLDWFKLNEMKPNADKSHLLVIDPPYVSVKLGEEVIVNDRSVDLLGIKIDEELKFTSHIKIACTCQNI